MSFQLSVRDYYFQSGCKQETHRSAVSWSHTPFITVQVDMITLVRNHCKRIQITPHYCHVAIFLWTMQTLTHDFVLLLVQKLFLSLCFLSYCFNFSDHYNFSLVFIITKYLVLLESLLVSLLALAFLNIITLLMKTKQTFLNHRSEENSYWSWADGFHLGKTTSGTLV